MPSSLHDPRYKILVAKIRQARLDAGLSQEEAAEKFGRPQSWISRCENKGRRVDLIEIEDLAELYGKPLSFFRTRPAKKR